MRDNQNNYIHTEKKDLEFYIFFAEKGIMGAFASFFLWTSAATK